METFRIHEDQENRVPEIRQKQGTMAVQQKRPVLGLIENDKRMNVQIRSKQPLGLVNAKAGLKNVEDKNVYRKENPKNLVNPIVPVAQFEAFKVYEDNYEERMARIQEKLKIISHKDNSCHVYTGTDKDKFLTKTEIAEMDRKKREEEAAKATVDDLFDSPVSNESPMSIEKSFDDSLHLAQNIFKNSKNEKDVFYEVEEYQVDIYRYLRERELHHQAKAGYMKKQPNITSSMRTILVDWLVEVAEEYKLYTETLYLAINFIDRFLSYMSVVKTKLQLVGTAAIFLASKYEQIYPPDIKEFVYITDDTYRQNQIIRMEHLMLKVLEFDLSVPTPLEFIKVMCVANKLNEKTLYLAMYISELGLLNGETYLEFLPSVIAASSIALARHTLGYEAWSESFVTSTGYELKHLRASIEYLNYMFAIAPTYPHHAIQDKYKQQKYMHVSQLRPAECPITFN